MSAYRNTLILGAAILLTVAICLRSSGPQMPFDEKLLSSSQLRNEATRLLAKLSDDPNPEESVRKIGSPGNRDVLLIKFPLLYSILNTATAESHLLIIPFGDLQTLCIRAIQRTMLKDVSDIVYIIPDGQSFDDPEFLEYREELAGAEKINDYVLYRRTHQSR